MGTVVMGTVVMDTAVMGTAVMGTMVTAMGTGTGTLIMVTDTAMAMDTITHIMDHTWGILAITQGHQAPLTFHIPRYQRKVVYIKKIAGPQGCPGGQLISF